MSCGSAKASHIFQDGNVTSETKKQVNLIKREILGMALAQKQNLREMVIDVVCDVIWKLDWATEDFGSAKCVCIHSHEIYKTLLDVAFRQLSPFLKNVKQRPCLAVVQKLLQFRERSTDTCKLRLDFRQRPTEELNVPQSVNEDPETSQNVFYH